MAANAPNGFLRRITGIQKNGALTTVITTTATLTEAFKELHVNSSKTYYKDDTTAKPNTAFEPFIKDIDEVLYDADGDESTTHDQVKINGKLEIKPTINFNFDISKRSLNYAKIDFKFENKLELTGTIGGALPTITAEKPIFIIKLSPLYTTTAPPIMVFPELFLKAGVVANLELELSATNITNFTISAFLEYKNGEWKYGYDKSFDNELSFNGKGNADVKFYLKPGIDFKLYDFDWAKGTIFAEAYIKAQAQAIPFQTCDVKAGLLAGGDVVLEFLGRTFSPAVKPLIFNDSITLYECPKVITVAATSITTHAAVCGGRVTNYDKDTIKQRGVCYSLKPNPTVKDSLTSDGVGKGDFLSNLTNLIEDTVYYYKAYTITQNDTVYGVELNFRTLSDSTFTDPRDGQKYRFKKFGTQIWMTKNLNYVTPSSNCYNNDPAECSIYGRLYDWSNSLAVAPPGWHLPTDAEWSTLTNFVNNNGGALKDTLLWNSPNTGATNSSGFKAIAAGYRNDFGQSLSKGNAAFFWSSTSSTSAASWSRILSSTDALIDRGYYYKLFFFSVRCIKD